MDWSLAPNVTFCWTGGKVIFLDAARDRYLALPDAASARFRDWLAGPASAPPFEQLTRAGLLVCDSRLAGVIEHCRVRVPDTDLDARQPDLASCSTFAAARAAVRARWRLKLRRFEQILSDIQSAQAGLSAAAAEDHACAYAQARRRLPLARQCLKDSLALLDFLTGRSIRATLVFGVMAEPFGAHCWVQSETAILNDSVDNVSRFTPIRAQ